MCWTETVETSASEMPLEQNYGYCGVTVRDRIRQTSEDGMKRTLVAMITFIGALNSVPGIPNSRRRVQDYGRFEK